MTQTKKKITIQRKKISLWLDKDLVPLFQNLNCKINKPFFEHQLRLLFHIYNLNYINPYWRYKIVPEAFKNSEQATKTISQMIIRMRVINERIKHLEETLNFLKPYL